MNMKPFNLEEARKGKPICTRDGRPAEFIAYVPKGEALSQVIVLVGNKVFQLSAEGFEFTSLQSDVDLFMMPEKRTVWVNFYTHTGSCGEGDCDYWETEKEANKGSAPSRIGGKAYPVEIDV
jgi:hypothetical protein